MKKFRELSEQHREKGRFKPTVPHNVSNTPGGTPRETSDSANVKLREAIKDKYDIGEYDQEGDMAKSDLRSIIANSKRVHDMLKDDDNLPERVQSKITKAEDYMSTVANYLEAEMNEEVEQIDEAVEKNTKPPFDAPYTKRKSTGPVVDKSGAKHGGMSIARHLARMAAQKQAGNIKEEKEKSRKAQIVKDASKKKDKFESDPIITDTTVKTDNLQ